MPPETRCNVTEYILGGRGFRVNKFCIAVCLHLRLVSFAKGLRRSVELERQKVIARENEISHLVMELSQTSQKVSSLQEDDIRQDFCNKESI